MSQGDSGEGNGSSWLSGLIQSAKEKSATALNLVKRDLAEFTSTMHDDTVKIATTVKDKLTQENATAATQKVKQGVTSLLGGISKALVIEPDDDYQLAKIVGGEAVVFDRFKARQHAIQIDPTTYTADPVPEDGYREWLATFDLDSMKGKVSELLVSNVEVRALYTQLVPLTVSNLDFWSRYFFKLHQLEEEEARRMELMKRADRVDGAKELGWDEEDDEDWTEVRGSCSSGSQLTPAADIIASLPPDTRLADNSTAAVAAEATCTASETTNVTSTIESTISTPPESDIISSTTTIIAPQDATIPLSCSSLPSAAATAECVSVNATAASVSADREESVVSSISQSSDRSWSAISESTKSDGLVVIGSTPERTTPSDEGSNAKESLDEDWEKDFDVEVTEQEVIAAKERLMSRATAAMATTPSPSATTTTSNTQDNKGEDWEDW
jgi:hypothetical protein